MGITCVNGTVTGPTGKSETLELLVDSGARYTLLPESVGRAIELKGKRTIRGVLADGTVIERQVSECHIALPPHGDAHTQVILGQGNDAALLGVITLEELGVLFNPYTRELSPMPLMNL